MPDIRDKHTRQALARAYIATDRDKGEAMRSIGYSKSYSVGGMLTKLYENPRLIAEIERIEVEEAEKSGYSIAKSHVEYEQARQHAISLNQPSAEVSAITGKARLYGMDKDNDMGTKEQPQAITPDQIEFYKRMAQAATAEQIGPRLSRETA